MARLVLFQQYDGLFVIAVAVLVELLVRSGSRMLEDGGYFEDGVFGYDFSEGCTSLESAAPQVRPHRESTLKRRRRRRSDLEVPCSAGSSSWRQPKRNGWMRSSKNSYREGRCALTDEQTFDLLVRADGSAIAIGPRTRDRANQSPLRSIRLLPRRFSPSRTARPRILDEIDLLSVLALERLALEPG